MPNIGFNSCYVSKQQYKRDESMGYSKTMNHCVIKHQITMALHIGIADVKYDHYSVVCTNL